MVAQALGRHPDSTLAARSDPWTVDRQLREQIAEHEQVLAGQPADPGEELAAAVEQLRPAQSWLEAMETLATGAARQLDDLGAWSGLSRRGREERRHLEERLAANRQQTAVAREAREDIASRVQALRRDQIAFDRFEKVQGWRRSELQRVRDRLDDHWAQTVAVCVGADDPLAFGIDKLRHARATSATRIKQLDTSLPPDRASEWEDARARSPRSSGPDTTPSGRWPTARRDSMRRAGVTGDANDHDAIAAAQGRVAYNEQRLKEAGKAECNLRDHLARISTHQQERRQGITDSAPRRQELESRLARLDAALDYTRPQRVHALVSDPSIDLVRRLGEPPAPAAGQAVWCHHALPVEVALDRNDGVSPPWTGWSHQTDRARREIRIADRFLQVEPRGINPVQWAELAQQGSTIRERVLKDLRVRSADEQKMTPTHEAEHQLGIDPSADPRGPQIGL